MHRLSPMEKLAPDYYMGEYGRDAMETDEEDSSEDELQKELQVLAGIRRCTTDDKQKQLSEFEAEMEAELNSSMVDYANQLIGHADGSAAAAAAGSSKMQTVKEEDEDSDDELDLVVKSCRTVITKPADVGGAKGAEPVKAEVKQEKGYEDMPGLADDEADVIEDDDMPPLEPASNDGPLAASVAAAPIPSSSHAVKEKELKVSPKKKVRIDESRNETREVEKDKQEEKGAGPDEAESSESEAEGDEQRNNPIRKMAKDCKREVKKEAKQQPEFYNASEDDENEKWVQDRRQEARGSGLPGQMPHGARPKLEDGSDAVLSCPCCMTLLTRDCQRHETYNDQYRAMFVENCVVDEAEKLAIERTGKAKRREKQRRKKEGLPAKTEPEADDIFTPVRCGVCTTKVAVMDSDEVYHFFNVLAGYS